MKKIEFSTALPACVLAVVFGSAYQARAGFNLGDGASYALLFEGGGTGNTLNQNNGNVNGNIGIGGAGSFSATGPGILTGDINFSAANTGQFHISNTTLNGTVNYGVSDVASTLTSLNTLNAMLGAEAGTALTVNINNAQMQTIQASSGMLDANGNDIFSVNSWNFNGGSTLTINGTSSQYVVLNFTSSANFQGTILLTGGITSDQVLFNFVGGSGLTGGPTLTISANAATQTGTFLDPNGPISLDSTTLNGRIFGGDSQNMQIVSGDFINAPPTPNPIPEPATVIAGALLLLPLGASFARGLRKNRA